MPQEYVVYGGAISLFTRKLELSRSLIHTRIRDQLDAAERARVGAWLEECGLAECFMP